MSENNSCHSPRDLLHDLPHESGALAQMAFGARDPGLGFAERGFLAVW